MRLISPPLLLSIWVEEGPAGASGAKASGMDWRRTSTCPVMVPAAASSAGPFTRSETFCMVSVIACNRSTSACSVSRRAARAARAFSSVVARILAFNTTTSAENWRIRSARAAARFARRCCSTLAWVEACFFAWAAGVTRGISPAAAEKAALTTWPARSRSLLQKNSSLGWATHWRLDWTRRFQWIAAFRWANSGAAGRPGSAAAGVGTGAARSAAARITRGRTNCARARRMPNC